MSFSLAPLSRLLVLTLGILLGSLAAVPAAVAEDQLSRLPGFNGPVQAISNPDADGTRYLGGEFTAFDAWDTGGGAAVAASSGAVDLSFPKVSQDAGNGQVLASVPDGEGGFYIGGNFNCLGPNLSGGCDGTGDFVRNNAAHINADGTVSAWDPSPWGPVLAIERTGTTVYVGGIFSCLGPNLSGSCDGEGDSARNNAAAVGTNGSILDWDPNVEGGVVRAIAPSGPTVYLGGSFASVGGETRRFAAAVTDAEAEENPGELVEEWNPIFGIGGGADGIFDIEVAAETIYIGGSFFVVNDVNRRGLVAVGSDGILSNWNPGIDTGFSSRVSGLEVSGEGDTVYVGGNFSSLGGQSRNNLGAVTTTGTGTITSWDPAPNGPVFGLAVGADTAFVAGTFTEVEGEPRHGTAAVSTDDGAVRAWDPNPKRVIFSSVQSLSISGSSVYIGGYFDTVGGEQRNRLAAVNERGVLTSWDPGAIGPAVEFPTPVRDIAVSGDTVYLGGDFSYVGSEIRNHLAAVGTDGTLVEAFNPNPDAPVFAVEVSGSEVYFGGTFQCLGASPDCGDRGDTPRSRLAAVDADGFPTAWAPEVNGPVATLDVSGSTVYLGGQFSSAGGETRNFAAAIGTDATATSWNPDIGGEVKTLEVSGGTVYLGGTFGQVGVQPRTNIAAVGTDGTLLPWNPRPNGAVNLLDASGDMIYFTGDFNCLGPNETGSCDGPEDTRRWGGLAAAGNDGSISSWYPEPNNNVNALYADGDTVYLGGYFDRLGMVTRNRSAAVSVTGAVLGPWPSTGQTLAAARSGSGTGTVTSTPAGIDCGSECSEVFGEIRPVTLTATADAGSTFSGWSGACSGTGPCEVTMDQARNVTAEFTEVFDLTVSKSGTGSGTVTSTPAGIDCGSDCSESYDLGEVVTLTASASAGSVFSGWSGACSGTGNCQVTMSQARTVGAEFALEKRDLTVSKSGTGSGTVTSTPAGIDCGSDCSESYDLGEVVTLTASASAGSVFSGWSGACSGTGNCQVTMSEVRSVTADFSLIPLSEPKLASLKLKGPSTVKKGRKGTYKVTISNTGNAAATGLVVKAQGKGVKGSKESGDLAGGKSKTATLSLKFRKKGKVGITFTVTSKNAGTKSVKKTVRVK